MPILGLINTERDANWRDKNIRREVFYQYPNGAAPLTGILSLMPEEPTDDPEFGWWEKRLAEQVCYSDTTSGDALLTSADGDIADKDATGLVSGTSYKVRVDADSATAIGMRVGHVIKMDLTYSDVTGTKTLRGVVTNVASTAITFTALNTVTHIDNAGTTDNNDIEILIIGTAYAEGQATLNTPATYASMYTVPTKFTNFCQIFRTPFFITGTAMKTGLKYDSTGAYKDMAKEASLLNSIEIEKAFLWGVKKQLPGATFSPGATVTTNTRTLGGILHFLSEWDLGASATDVAYRSGAAVTADTSDFKRIINNTAGTLSEKQYDGYLERVFRFTNNAANEKLVLCGSGFLSVINQLFKSKSVLSGDLPKQDTYGMDVVKHLCPFGTLYYKTHPLFSQNAILRYCAMIIDVGNLRYRYLDGRDVELLKNRQNPGDDFRMDEWLGECGLEVRFPESCMFIRNVQSYLS